MIASRHRVRHQLAGILVLLLAAPGLQARSAGITSQSGAPGHGSCSSCHNGSGSFDYAPSLPSATVDASTTNQFTLTFTKSSGSDAGGAGFNLSASAGTLSTATSSCSIRASSGQLTHSSRCNGAGPFTWTFNWTAPSTGGSQTFYYCARAVNANGNNGGDAHGDCATTTITVNPPPSNDPPVSNNDIATQAGCCAATEDTPYSFQFAADTFTDPDGDDLSYTAALPNGSALPSWLSFTPGTRTFSGTPENGDVPGVTVRVMATDTVDQSATDDFTITVTNTNDAPVAANDSYTVNRDSSGNFFAVLNNDEDVDVGDSLTIIAVTTPSQGGAVSIVSGTSLSYTPAAGFVGSESFIYTIEDGDGEMSDATVSVTVRVPPPPNSVPQGVADSYAVDEDQVLTVQAPGVLGNDSDGDGDPLTAVAISQPSSGSLTAASDGSFTYTPVQDFNGTATFTYRASDGTAQSSTVTVSVTVNAVADAPFAMNDSYTTAEGAPLDVGAPGVLANDADVDGDTLTAVVVAAPSDGTLTLNPDGSFTYTPSPGFSGSDSFTYKANDGGLDSNTATVVISVGDTNVSPAAVADDYATEFETPLTVLAPGVLANDSDPDGDPLTAVLVAMPTNGTVGLNANGSFTYTPSAGFSGVDGFSYQANDGTANSGVAEVTIAVADDERTNRGGGGGGPLLPGLYLPLLVLHLFTRRRR